MAGLAGDPIRMPVEERTFVSLRGHVPMTVRAFQHHRRVGGTEIRTLSGHPVTGEGVAVLAVEVGPGSRHVDIERKIRGVAVGEGKVATFDRIAAARLGVTLETGRAHRPVHRLCRFVHGDGHVLGVRDEFPVHLGTAVGLLVAQHAVDVRKLFGRRLVLGFRAEADVAVAAGVPVSKDVDAVAIDRAGILALWRLAVDHVRRVSLPLIHHRAMYFVGLGLVALEAGLGAGPREVVMTFATGQISA